jgi:hypothetical protein
MPGNNGADSYRRRYDYMLRYNPSPAIRTAAEANAAMQALARDPLQHRRRMDLAIYLLLHQDPGNGQYQVYILEKLMKEKFSPEDMQYYRQHFGTPAAMQQAGLYNVGSEYHQLFFPLLVKLGKTTVAPMDCQLYDEQWSAAWARVDSLAKAMQLAASRDSSSPEAATLALIERYGSYSKKEGEWMEQDPYAAMNSDRYKTLDASWNFYGGEAFYGFPGYPTEAVREMIRCWLLRNNAMCANILRISAAAHAKRVVVAVGASHTKWMEDIFRSNPAVKLVSYSYAGN